jgi:hypothetical protein
MTVLEAFPFPPVAVCPSNHFFANFKNDKTAGGEHRQVDWRGKRNSSREKWKGSIYGSSTRGLSSKNLLNVDLMETETASETSNINSTLTSLAGDRLCGLVVRVPGYRSKGPAFDFRHYQIF